MGANGLEQVMYGSDMRAALGAYEIEAAVQSIGAQPYGRIRMSRGHSNVAASLLPNYREIRAIWPVDRDRSGAR